jgi:two-component system cell cycle response regulator
MSARILVVDDIPINVKLLEAKLLVEYYDVITANDGETALAMAESEAPDIILLDVMMPGIDGYEVCRRLKANPKTVHIPVVMVTALNQPKDRIMGLEAGADDFLTKPPNDIALFARISSLVRLKRASDEWRAREATAVELGVTSAIDSTIEEDQPGNILLVADGMLDRKAIEKMLIEQGNEVEVCDDDAAAFRLASSGDYDLVLLSDGDREGDALRLCSQLRSTPETRHGPILLIVPEDIGERLAKAMEIGVNDYLMRPVENDELLARTRTQIRRKRYEERLRDNLTVSVNAAVTDSLTGMYNRRYLESHFTRLSDRLRDAGKPISLLMLDIDHFKAVNDTYGHDVGDEVLKAIARRIQGNLRGFDTATRFGGEEFIVLLPDAPLAAAAAAGERLCQTVAGAPVTISALEIGLEITISVGVATAVAGESSLEEIIRKADGALYDAKNAGRNRVMTAVSAPADEPLPTENTVPEDEPRKQVG